MADERVETLNFLTRMALVVAEADREEFKTVMVEKDDLAQLVQRLCLAEKDKDERQQRAFERLCAAGATFYEA